MKSRSSLVVMALMLDCVFITQSSCCWFSHVTRRMACVGRPAAAPLRGAVVRGRRHQGVHLEQDRVHGHLALCGAELPRAALAAIGLPEAHCVWATPDGSPIRWTLVSMLCVACCVDSMRAHAWPRFEPLSLCDGLCGQSLNQSIKGHIRSHVRVSCDAFGRFVDSSHTWQCACSSEYPRASRCLRTKPSLTLTADFTLS